MSKVVKITAWAVGAVVALFIVVVIVVAVTFDPNDYKPTIVEQVKKATGRDLVIEGDIGLSLFPWIGADVGRVSLGNAPGFGDEPFARIDSAGVKLKLLPLLTQNVELGTLVLHGLRLNLTTLENGTTNWDDLAEGEVTAAGEQAPADVTPVAALAVGGLDVRDAAVVWDDRQAGARYEITDIALRSGAIAPGEPTDVSMTFGLKSNAPELSGTVGLDTMLTVDVGAGRYHLADMDLTVDAAGGGLPGGKLEARVRADTVADLKAQTLELTGLEANVAGMSLQGAVSGTRIVDAPSFSGELSVPDFSARELLHNLGVALDTADGKALASASATLRFTATQDSLSVEEMNAKLDDSTLDVTAKVSNFDQPAIRFAVALDAIDLDRYLPPAPAAGRAPAAPAAAAAPAGGGGTQTPSTAARPAPSPGAAVSAGAARLPVETLRDLDVDGTVKVGSLKAANLTVTDFNATVKGKGGVIAMHPATAALYGGSYAGNVGLDARAQHGGALVVSVNERLEGIQAGPLLRDLTGTESVTGTGSVSARLTTRSTSGEDFIEHLNGDATLNLRNGAVKGVNIAGIIRTAYARFKGQSTPAETGPNETDFTALDGKFRFVNGVAHDDLSAQSPLLRVQGKGQVDLVREQIDYVVTANVVGTLEGQGGKTLDELEAVPLPIRVKGALADPRFSLDMAEIMKGRAKQEVNKRIDKEADKLKEKLGDKLGEDVGEKLKGLFR